jgi:hypothetical protein
MADIRFGLGAYVLQFSKGIQYPVQKPVEQKQVMVRMGGGAWQVEDLGGEIAQFPIVFKGLPAEDYINLMYFHKYICVGAANNFTYYDENADSFLVKCLTTKINFPETSYRRHSGELLLERVE